MNPPSLEHDPLDALAEGFVERLRQGERPGLTEYTEKYPELAERIRKLFPALVLLEDLGSVGGASPVAGSGLVPGAAAVPRELGEYRILREVGRGGMGIVYEALQQSLGRHVALKVLPYHALLRPTHIERFRREARAAAQLHHTNIVPVFGVGEHGGLHYYAMQYIHGQGLDEVLQEVKRLRSGVRSTSGSPRTMLAEGMLSGQFDSPATQSLTKLEPAQAEASPAATQATPFEDSGRATHAATPSEDAERATPQRSESAINHAAGQLKREAQDSRAKSHSDLTSQPDAQYFRSVAQLAIQVAEALDYAHQQGVLHRDIKPSNLLLDTSGRVWVTDFGLAKADQSDELTHTGDLVGTLRYMAPERLEGKADRRSDVYGLGVTLYEMLTLAPPFEDASRPQLMNRILRQQPQQLRKLDAHIPRDLETIVLKAMAKEPGDRYATAGLLAEDLRRFLTDRPLRAQRPSVWERGWRWCRRNPALATASGLAVSALAAVAALSIALAIQQYHAAADLRGEQHQTAQALEQAQGQRDLAEQLSTNLALDQALNLCERGDVALGLLWLTRALQIAPANERELQGVIRANLAAWERELPPLKGLLQQQDSVLAAAWSPDGNTILTGGWDGYGRLWSAAGGNPVRPPWWNAAHVRAVAFSPDGRRALAAGKGNAQVWDVATGNAVGRPILSQVWINAATFSPDGNTVVAGAANGKVYRWDATTGKFLGELLRHGTTVNALAFSPDGRNLLTGADDGTARLWDAITGQPRGQPLPHQGAVGAVAFSHDGTRVITGSMDWTARLWEARTGKLLGMPLVHGGLVDAVAFSSDDRTVLTGSWDGTARLWEAATGKPLGLPLRHRGQVFTAAFSPDGKTLLTGGTENVARLWDMSTVRRPRLPFRHGTCWMRAVAFSPTGDYLLTGADDGTARLWDLRSEQPVGKPLPHRRPVRAIAWRPDGQAVLTGSFDGTAQLWEVPTGRPLRPPLPHRDAVWAVAFSPDGRSLLTAEEDGTVRRWDSSTGNPVGEPLHHAAKVSGLAWSPDGRTIATACHDGAAYLWDAVTGQARGLPMRHQAPVWAVAFSPDGRTLLTGSWDSSARLWNAITGQAMGKPFSHQAKVEAVAFSPDGQTILTGSFDGTGRLWSIATGKPLGPPLKSGDFVLAVAFRPDGRAVVTAGSDMDPYLWDVPPPAEGPVEDLVLRSELITGMQLDPEGAASGLSAEAWYQHRGR